MSSSKKTSAFEKAVAGRPVNRTAIRVTSKAPEYKSSKKILTADQATPLPVMPFPGPPECDLTGRQQGRLKVLGYWADSPRGKGRWVVQCQCGTYTIRTPKALKNPANDQDRCEECRQLAYLKRHDRYLRGCKEDK